VAEEVGALRDRLVRHYSEVNSELHDEYIRPFEGIAELLQALFVAGVPMGVVTSKRRCNAEADLAHYGLNRWLGLTVAADDLPWHKPDPRPILEGLQILSDAARTTGAGQALGFEPSRCVYVGDSPFDIQAGNAAGLSTIAVTWGLFPNHILAEACPSYTVDTRQELQALLLG
jgi:pyrophosphatase PpaX